MEELQDAIEDVQYLQAVKSKDSGPSPTEPWPFPSEKALEDFNTERLQQDPNCFSLETICAGILGLYLVRMICDAIYPITIYARPLPARILVVVVISASLLFVPESTVRHVLRREEGAWQIRFYSGRHTVSGEAIGDFLSLEIVLQWNTPPFSFPTIGCPQHVC